MPNQKTGVWYHYNETNKGKKIVGECKYCGQTYANNATRMKRHLTICKNCPEGTKSSYRKLLQLSAGTTSGKSLLQELIELGNSSQTADLPKVKTKNTEQPALEKGDSGASVSRLELQDTRSLSSSLGQQSFLANSVDKMSKDDQERANETLARAIFASHLPLSVLENQYWKEHYKLICPRYKLPSGYHLSHSLLDKEYDRVQAMVTQRIRQAESLTLMSNGWTDTEGNSFLSIMFATPEPTFLKAISTKSPHAGEYIANLLSEVIESAGPDRVQAAVTDNASYMQDVWQLLKVKYPHLIIFRCLADGLNCLANDIVNMSTMKTVLANCKTTVKAFNNHPAANQTLKRLQREKQSRESALFLPLDAKWNSVTKCLDSLLCTKNCLQYASVEDTVPHIIPGNIQEQINDNVFEAQVQEAFNLLLPISEAIKKLEQDAPTLSNVPEMFRKMQEKLSELLSSSSLSHEEQTELKQIFTKTFEFCSHPAHLAANLLDPKQCGKKLSENELSSALDTIAELAKNIPNIDEITVMTDIAEYRAKEKLWSQEIIWRASENMSPLTWWKGYCNTRQLSTIAVRILSIPPTITACEENLRAYNLIETKKMNRLTEERAAKLASVSLNLLLLQQNQSQAYQEKRMKYDELPTGLLWAESSYNEQVHGSSMSESDLPLSELEFTSKVSTPMASEDTLPFNSVEQLSKKQ